MRIGVISDSHDNVANLRAAVEALLADGVSTFLHLGDWVAPFSMQVFVDRPQATVYAIFGNCDGARAELTRMAAGCAWIDLAAGDHRELEIGGRRIFMSHHPLPADVAAASARYDAAFHGHTHRRRDEVVGDCCLGNPGEISGARYGEPSYGVYDCATNSFEVVPLANPILPG